MHVPEGPGERGDVSAEPGPRTLSVRLFGELELRVGDELLPRLESARARSLLAFLMLHRGAPQSRQRLAFMLWPDSSERQARTNLRHLIHTLRQSGPDLDEYLDVTPQTLAWRHDAANWVDVVAFEAAQRAADAPGVSSRHEMEALRDAIDLYRGDLLDGCYDEWVLDVREGLRDRYLAQLHRLADVLADDGEHAEAIRVGRELLRCDPLREGTYRFLMQANVAAGDRAAAVRVYHECVSMLQRELGVEPSPETLAAYAALTNYQPSSEIDRSPLVGASKLVGRDSEWEQLTDCWRDAERGRAQFVLITGEPGVGKTRLAEELMAWCRHRGAIVAEARSYPTEGELGYGVVISWLRTVDVHARLREQTPGMRSELGRLLPEFDDTSARLAPADLDVAEQRQRLFDAIGRTLAPPDRPTVLIADDAQWCDAQSLQVVHYLVRRDSSSPLLVVATARKEDVTPSHPLRALIGALRVIDRTVEMPLERLTRLDTEELARATATTDVEGDFDGLFADTEGNPLFIVETIRAGWTGALSNASTLTPKLLAVIDSRLRQLSQPARDLLEMAATVGREFTTDVLDRVLAPRVNDVASALDELWRRGIIRERGTEAYDFGHGKIREVAYDSMSPATRRRNHCAIASTLIELRHRDLDSVSGEVARHFDRGGQLDEAVTWYERAAGEAQRMYADVEATRLLGRACELAVQMQPERQLELMSAFATPLAATDGFASLRLADVQRSALDLASSLGVEPEPSLLRSVAMSSLCRKEFEKSGEVAGRLRSLAAQRNDTVLGIESEYLLGIGAFWGGSLDRARAHFERVVHDFDPDRRVEHLVRFGHDPLVVCTSRLANTLWFLGHSDAALAMREDALTVATDVGHPFSKEVALIFAALLSVDLEEIDRYRDLVAAFGNDSQHHPFTVAKDALLGYADVLDGHISRGIERIRSSLSSSAVDHAPGQRASHTRVLLAAYDAAGDARGGLEAADEALGADGTRLWESESRRLRAVFLHRLGAPPDEVAAELERAIVVARQSGAVGPRVRAERTRSELGLGH